MIIQCPACGARAKLPDSKEGAKVRCVECERVYVAGVGGKGGGSGRSGGDNTGMMIGIGAAVVGVILVFFIQSRKGSDATLPTNEVIAEAPPEEVEVDFTGWDSKLVKRARDLHKYGFASQEYDLQNSVAWPMAWAASQGLSVDGAAPTDISGFSLLSADEVDTYRADTLAAMVSVDKDNLVGNWKPFNGSVVTEGDDIAVVRLDLEPRTEDIGTGTRGITWKLTKDGGTWKAWSWDRFLSAEELKPKKGKRVKNYAKKTLSDGSQVIEGEPGPLPYMESTTPEQQVAIDALIVDLVNLELPARKLTEVKNEIVGYGKHAVPPLLTKFYELNKIGFDEMDQAIAAQLVHSMLGDITGYVTTFSAHQALGATEERRESGVKQWFGWYNRKFKKFEGRDEAADELEEALEILSPAERKAYEKMLRQLEADKANKNPHKNN